MRKTRATRVIQAGLAILILALVIEVILVHLVKALVSITPSGISGSGSALFYVTNGESRAINLACLEVQVKTNGSWRTVFKETSPILSRTKAKAYDWSGKLAAGQYRAVHVDQPTNGVWRVSLTYLKEAGGLQTRLAKLFDALASGGVSGRGASGTAYSGAQHRITSQEIPQ